MSKDSNDSSQTKFVSSDNLIPVSRAEISVISPLPANFYAKISEGRFVLVGRKGSQGLESLIAFQDERIIDLFVHAEEYKNCVGVNLQVAEMAVDRSEISDPRKVEFLFKASNSVLKEISEMGFDHTSMEHAKVIANSVITLVAAKRDLSDVVELMSQVSDELVRHSMAVSAISLLIAEQMKWTIRATLQKLALSAFLHDIGMKDLPPELVNKPRHKMTHTEVKDYESHVMRGVETLQSMPSVFSEIISVAMEHHENAIGQGYPKHLRDIKMNPFSRIVALADAFADLTLPGVNNPNPKSASEAIKYIELTLGQPYSKPAFQGLKQALSIPQKGVFKIAA
jgi:putative nucleotidyltransferase with HDIG domain